jgi:murein DD-endopeptidase MepM/ murein hydrolase activator NlpD
VKNLLKSIFLCFVIFVFSGSLVYAELSPDDKRSLNYDAVFYSSDPVASCNPDITSDISIDTSESKKATWQFLASKGLTATQIAGIMGNMQAEAHFESRLVEYGYKNSRGEISKAGKPSSLDDDMPPSSNDKGQPGYGIVQWTSPGRKKGLVELAASRNVKVSDFKTQLDYLWQELTTTYKKQLDKVKATSTIRAASDIILIEFEVPGGRFDPKVQSTRAGFGQKIFDLYANDSSIITAAPIPSNNDVCSEEGSAVGFNGFPLLTTKSEITRLNKGQFSNGKMSLGGHPYAAHDIMVSPGVQVASILAGEVISISKDKCPGRLISIYSPTENVTVSYLHLSMSQDIVKKGDQIKAGQVIGVVGSSVEGCGSAHLHIDAALSDQRPGCKRENCPAANAAKFLAGSKKIGLPESLYKNYENLP